MPNPAEPIPDARPTRVWRRGDGPTRMRTWGTSPPTVEVRADGEWRTAVLAQREDRAGSVIYHLDVQLPGEVGPVRRTYAYDPATIRPVRDPGGPPVETYWDAEGRITGRTRPPAP